MTNIAERVAAGAALLDQHRPGWADKINTESLRMSNCTRCILGQVFGDYWRGVRLIHKDDVDADKEEFYVFTAWTTAHGFNVDQDSGTDEDYRTLTHAWLDLIESRETDDE